MVIERMPGWLAGILIRLAAAFFGASEWAATELMTELVLRDPGPWLRSQAWREGYDAASIKSDRSKVHEPRPLPPWVTSLDDFGRGYADALEAWGAWESGHPPRGRHHGPQRPGEGHAPAS